MESSCDNIYIEENSYIDNKEIVDFLESKSIIPPINSNRGVRLKFLANPVNISDIIGFVRVYNYCHKYAKFINWLSYKYENIFIESNKYLICGSGKGNFVVYTNFYGKNKDRRYTNVDAVSTEGERWKFID